MFLLDTNVLSEAKRQSPAVSAWLATVRSDQLFISVISLGEIMKGVERQLSRDDAIADQLLQWLNRLRSEYKERTLPVSSDIALAWGKIAAGRTRGVPDALLAATAQVHGFVMVTRNVRDFADLPLTLLNPWDVR